MPGRNRAMLAERLRAMKLARTLLASIALAALVACAPQDASSAGEASPAPTASAAPAASPQQAGIKPVPTPAASAAPLPAVSSEPATPAPSPVPSLAPTPTPIIQPPNAPPKILSYSISATTVHPGETVSGTVLTTSNVASVEASIASYVIPLAKTGIGHFTLSYVVPNIPKPFRGTYALRIIAHNTQGATATESTSLTIR